LAKPSASRRRSPKGKTGGGRLADVLAAAREAKDGPLLFLATGMLCSADYLASWVFEGDNMRCTVMMVVAVLAVPGLMDRDAFGACVDDIQQLQVQAKQHPTQGDRKKYNKELKAAQERVNSESECLNAVSRARKALNAPPQPDANLPTQPVQPLNQK
jgi:hypothetical protein